MPRPTSLLAAALLSSCLALPACGGGGGSSAGARPPDPSMLDAQSTSRLLEAHAWRITDWNPEVAIVEPTFQQLLNQQVQQMQVRFEQGRLRADSPSIHIDRAYRITQATGPEFVILVTDENGVSLQSTCQFDDTGARIEFHGDTAPWRGIGHLVRQ